MYGEWAVTDCHTELRNINHVEHEAKEETSQDFRTVNGTGAGHEF
jgi:hypothetical protein